MKKKRRPSKKPPKKKPPSALVERTVQEGALIKKPNPRKDISPTSPASQEGRELEEPRHYGFTGMGFDSARSIPVPGASIERQGLHAQEGQELTEKSTWSYKRPEGGRYSVTMTPFMPAIVSANPNPNEQAFTVNLSVEIETEIKKDGPGDRNDHEE